MFGIEIDVKMFLLVNDSLEVRSSESFEEIDGLRSNLLERLRRANATDGSLHESCLPDSGNRHPKNI